MDAGKESAAAPAAGPNGLSSGKETEELTPIEQGTNGLSSGAKTDDVTPIEQDVATVDEEGEKRKVRYPRSVFLIVSNEFCERFTFYGLRSVLSIYLKNILGYTDEVATIIYHTFNMLCYFFPIIGGFLADSLLGKFRTILYLSIVYAMGSIVLSLAAADDAIEGMPSRSISILGLVLIAVGTGGIKPCVSAFGGDQFVLPEQEKQLSQFFSLFYFAINAGSLISTFITPILREDVKCLGHDSCYSLAFGVPAILMIVATVIFVAGKPLYKIEFTKGNVLVDTIKCIHHALSRRRKLKRGKNKEKREHWLYFADDKYDKKTLDGIKATLGVLFMYIPLPVFWALFDQQGSTWTFQATRMTGELGSWALKPDQMQVVNSVLILVFIPLFQTVVYPLFSKCNLLTKPLQRLGVGGVVAALSFVISGVVELQLEPHYAVVPKAGEGQLRIFNGLNETVFVKVGDMAQSSSVPPVGAWESLHLGVQGSAALPTEVQFSDNTQTDSLEIFEKQATSYVIASHEGIEGPFTNDQVEKSEDGAPVIRILYVFYDSSEHVIQLTKGSEVFEVIIEAGMDHINASAPTSLEDGTYQVTIDENPFGSVQLKLGGVYSYVIVGRDSEIQSTQLHTITSPNSVHMLWLIPQYVVLTAGEIMFSITGLEFSYSQAPANMKSVLTSGWLLSVAFGNLIVIIIEGAQIFESQAYEFFLFAGLMAVDMVIFALMARGYKYVDPSKVDDSDDDKKDNTVVDHGNDFKSGKQEGIDNPQFISEDKNGDAVKNDKQGLENPQFSKEE